MTIPQNSSQSLMTAYVDWSGPFFVFLIPLYYHRCDLSHWSEHLNQGATQIQRNGSINLTEEVELALQ